MGEFQQNLCFSQDINVYYKYTPIYVCLGKIESGKVKKKKARI